MFAFVCVSIGLRWDSQGEIDGAMHVERRTQLLCMLYESVTPSLLLALPLMPLPRLPIIHSSFYGRKESEAWQVNAVKACHKLCVCVSLPSLKRRKSLAWDWCLLVSTARQEEKEGGQEWRQREVESVQQGSDFSLGFEVRGLKCNLGYLDFLNIPHLTPTEVSLWL